MDSYCLYVPKKGIHRWDIEPESRHTEAWLSLLGSTSKLASGRSFYTMPHHWHIVCTHFAQRRGTIFHCPTLHSMGVFVPPLGALI